VIEEIFIDYLVGPTHYYGGLSYGNIASMEKKGTQSSPKRAALQSLEKMRLVYELGSKQLVLPPHYRPENNNYSSAYMWAANMATCSPSSDNSDHITHITLANMAQTKHRSIEHEQAYGLLKQIFANEPSIKLHPPIDSKKPDEGSANHIRLGEVSETGFHIFVHNPENMSHYPSRQSKAAHRDIIQRHGITKNRVLHIAQGQKAMDAGVFHNDVIAFGFDSTLICHENAFDNQPEIIEEMKDRYLELTKKHLRVVTIQNSEISLEDAVSSYVFNSQVILGKDNKAILLYPKKCEAFKNVLQCIQKWTKNEALFSSCFPVDVSESMGNGGGPACLRFRLIGKDLCIKPQVVFTLNMYKQLSKIINNEYPDSITIADLNDAKMQKKIKHIYQILYDFFQIAPPKIA
jgi:succinylarginine dihydrolase